MQSVALAEGGRISSRVFDGEDSRSASWPSRTGGFLAESGLSFSDLDRIVVGTGPGSFAGIRGALSFAQGLAIGIRAKRPAVSAPIVYGVSSAAAVVQDDVLTAVIGDARRGLFWVVVHEGFCTVAELRLVSKEELPSAVPDGAVAVTPDGARIGGMLGDMFGERFAGNRYPSAERIARIAIERPDLLTPEPLPIYLSPAVRA